MTSDRYPLLMREASELSNALAKWRTSSFIDVGGLLNHTTVEEHKAAITRHTALVAEFRNDIKLGVIR